MSFFTSPATRGRHRIPLNIFDRLARRELAAGFEPMGKPLGIDSGPFLARMATLAASTGGAGFRQPSMKNGPGEGRRYNGNRADNYGARRALYRDNLAAESAFRKAKSKGRHPWGIGRIRDAIEAGEHLRPASKGA